jgi:hypothetical protein
MKQAKKNSGILYAEGIAIGIAMAIWPVFTSTPRA